MSQLVMPHEHVYLCMQSPAAIEIRVSIMHHVWQLFFCCLRFNLSLHAVIVIQELGLCHWWDAVHAWPLSEAMCQGRSGRCNLETMCQGGSMLSSEEGVCTSFCRRIYLFD